MEISFVKKHLQIRVDVHFCCQGSLLPYVVVALSVSLYGLRNLDVFVLGLFLSPDVTTKVPSMAFLDPYKSREREDLAACFYQIKRRRECNGRDRKLVLDHKTT